MADRAVWDMRGWFNFLQHSRMQPKMMIINACVKPAQALKWYLATAL